VLLQFLLQKRRLEMRFLKLVGLTLCAISLSSFLIASAHAATTGKYHSVKHHYHHHHAAKGKTGGRH
jgi:hypothetical protein